MKPITTKLKTNKYRQLKLAIMHEQASKYGVQYQVFESTVLKGFVFSIKRNKTIRCEES